MSYNIIKGMAPPNMRPSRQVNLDNLVNLAREMQVGDAVSLRLSEANQFRIILAAQGFECRTDGWRCTVPGKILAFKLLREPSAIQQ